VLYSSQDHLRTSTRYLDHIVFASAKSTYNAEPVFLHAGGSTGHVVHFGASGERNVDALFFMLGWDWYGFYKKVIVTHYAELVFLQHLGYEGYECIPVRPGRETSIYYFSCSVGTSTDSLKSMSGHIILNLCFWI
jgi:hypothetical protein